MGSSAAIRRTPSASRSRSRDQRSASTSAASSVAPIASSAGPTGAHPTAASRTRAATGTPAITTAAPSASMATCRSRSAGGGHAPRVRSRRRSAGRAVVRSARSPASPASAVSPPGSPRPPRRPVHTPSRAAAVRSAPRIRRAACCSPSSSFSSFTAASVTVPSCSVVKSWNTGSVCTWPAIAPISRSVMPPSAAATRTMVRTSASGASKASSARIAKLRVA